MSCDKWPLSRGNASDTVSIEKSASLVLGENSWITGLHRSAHRGIVPGMDGINAAVVGYLLLCMVWPQLVKNKAYYYLSLASMLLYVLLMALAACFTGYAISRAIVVVTMLCTGFGLVLAVLASGGLSFREFAGEMGGAFDTFRHGEGHDKPVIVPITGEQPKKRDEDVGPRERYTIYDRDGK